MSNKTIWSPTSSSDKRGGDVTATQSGDKRGLDVNILSSGSDGASEIQATKVTLAGGAEFTGTAIDMDGYSQINITVYSDVSSADEGLIFEHSSDGVTWRSLKTFDYTAGSTRTFQFGTQYRYFRTRYVNGPSAQSEFDLQAMLFPGTTLTTIHRIDGFLAPDRTVELTRSITTGRDPDDVYINTPQPGVFSAGSTTTPLAAGGEFTGEWLDASRYANLQIWISADVAYDDTAYTDSFGQTGGILFDLRQADSGGPDYSFSIATLNNPPIHFFKSKPLLKWMRLRYTNGVSPQTEFIINIEAEVNASPAPMSTFGAPMSQATLAETVRGLMFGLDNNNLVEPIPLIAAGTEITNASNTVVTKSVLVTEDENGDYGRLQRVNNAQKVYLDNDSETVGFIDVVGQDAGNVTQITSPTATANDDHFYVVAISSRDEFSNITQIDDTMGFDSWTLVADTLQSSAESRTSVYYGVATSSLSDGTITANFSQAADHCVISVTRFSNIDKSDPVNSLVTFGANNSAGSYSNSLAASSAQGMFYLAMGFEQGSHTSATTPSGATEQFEDGSAAGNDQIQNIITNPIVSGGSLSFSGTVTGAADITYVGVSFKPVDAVDPVIQVSHSEGATVLSSTLTSESDTNFEQDITVDTAWDVATLDAMTITVSPTTISAADAEIDRVYIEVVSSSSVLNVPVRWTGDKPSA